MYNFGIPEDFDFPEWGKSCRICEDNIPLERYRKSGLCDDCEFDTLTPIAWLEVFAVQIEQWSEQKAS